MNFSLPVSDTERGAERRVTPVILHHPPVSLNQLCQWVSVIEREWGVVGDWWFVNLCFERRQKPFGFWLLVI